jgi:hypothetical protein
VSGLGGDPLVRHLDAGLRESGHLALLPPGEWHLLAAHVKRAENDPEVLYLADLSLAPAPLPTGRMDAVATDGSGVSWRVRMASLAVPAARRAPDPASWLYRAALALYLLALGLVVFLFPGVSNLWVSVFVLVSGFFSLLAAYAEYRKGAA